MRFLTRFTSARTLTAVALLAAMPVVAACGGGTDSPSSPSPNQPRGEYSQTDLVVGTGATVVLGSRVAVAYGGWLYDPTRADNKGTQFDGSNGAVFTIAPGAIIQGWVQGVVGMQVGGRRRLVIPPELGYGAQGNGPIPPNATLVFDVELLAVQ